MVLYNVAKKELDIQKKENIPGFKILTQKQKLVLEFMYNNNPFADNLSLDHIGSKIRLSPKFIKRWFIYKRSETQINNYGK